MIGWDRVRAGKPFARKVGPHRYRGAGMAVTMQGSGLANLDANSATIRLEDNTEDMEEAERFVEMMAEEIRREMGEEV